MSGPPGTESLPASNNRGLLSRTVQLLFKIINTSLNEMSLKISVLEIYNETLTDLLRESSVTEQSTTTSSFAGGTPSRFWKKNIYIF